jgi:uncharacterized protein (TIGR02271 family)
MQNVNLSKGMHVRSIDGDKIGKIIATVDNTFLVEKGILFPEDYTFSYNAIERVEGDTLYVKYTMQQVKDRNFDLSSINQTAASTSYSDSTYRQGASAFPESVNTSTGSGFAAGSSNLGAQSSSTYSQSADLNQSTVNRVENEGSTVRVPLREEQVDVSKTVHEAGEIRLHKTVITETRHIEVPVMREEVQVERVQVSPTEATSMTGMGAEFTENTISVPIREEEIEIHKRPVVREEIRLTKNVRVDEKSVDTQVRREEAHIEREGNVTKLSDTSSSASPLKNPKAS